jgi:histidyl-tRNA synthetase
MLLNSSNEDEQILALETPIIRNFLKKDSKIHYEKFMEYLDMLNIPYEINNTLIPEFSYYTNTVWNIRNTITNNIISN